MSHISDSLKGLIGDDPVDEPSRAVLSISVGKLEKLSAKVRFIMFIKIPMDS